MIRTKDLVLFLLAFIFLALVITFTLSGGQNEAGQSEVAFVTNGVSVGEGVYEEEEVDRQSTIARLRQAILGREVIRSPITEVVEDEITEESGTETGSEVVLQKCSEMKDALALARTWPREGVSVQVAEGARLVSWVEKTVIPKTIATTSSSTVPALDIEPLVKVTPLIQLPLVPLVGEARCLASEVVGVATTGSLIFNSDAIAYYTKTNEELIGYARDGVPIHGNYVGSVDECGGYEVNGQYRYSVSSERNFILGCYKAAPQIFLSE